MYGPKITFSFTFFFGWARTYKWMWSCALVFLSPTHSLPDNFHFVPLIIVRMNVGVRKNKYLYNFFFPLSGTRNRSKTATPWSSLMSCGLTRQGNKKEIMEGDSLRLAKPRNYVPASMRLRLYHLPVGTYRLATIYYFFIHFLLPWPPTSHEKE